jgi:hypothetical protein
MNWIEAFRMLQVIGPFNPYGVTKGDFIVKLQTLDNTGELQKKITNMSDKYYSLFQVVYDAFPNATFNIEENDVEFKTHERGEYRPFIHFDMI